MTQNTTWEPLLKKCYDKLAGMPLRDGESLESYEGALLVEKYRRYWKPETVNVILLAESHVYTSDEERQVEVLGDKIVGSPGYPQGCPTAFSRFVYCLGYGENGILNGKVENNTGPHGFWKILYACANPVTGEYGCQPITFAGPNSDRIGSKIALLHKLKEQGIWLVDASITSVYGMSTSRKKKIAEMSWENYTRGVIADAIAESNPKLIIVIGETVVAPVTVPDLREMGYNDKNCKVKPQPAYLRSDKRDSYFASLYPLVQESFA